MPEAYHGDYDLLKVLPCAKMGRWSAYLIRRNFKKENNLNTTFEVNCERICSLLPPKPQNPLILGPCLFEVLIHIH